MTVSFMNGKIAKWLVGKRAACARDGSDMMQPGPTDPRHVWLKICSGIGSGMEYVLEILDLRDNVNSNVTIPDQDVEQK